MPIPDEKSRSWTRPEDYWPPRRLKRLKKPAANTNEPVASGEPLGHSRPFPASIPYLLLMLSMAVLSVAIITVVWPKDENSIPTNPPAIEKSDPDAVLRKSEPAR